MIYTLSFHRPWPVLDVDAGHFVAVNSTLPYPFRVLALRPLAPNCQAVLGALQAGAAELLGPPGASAADLAAALGGSYQSGRVGRTLTLLK